MCEKLGAKCLRSDAKTMHHRLTILTLKKTRIRRKTRPTKSYHYSIYDSSKHKRQNYTHRRDTKKLERRPEKSEKPKKEPEKQKQDSNSDSKIEIEKARIETKPQKTLRKYTRQEEI